MRLHKCFISKDGIRNILVTFNSFVNIIQASEHFAFLEFLSHTKSFFSLQVFVRLEGGVVVCNLPTRSGGAPVGGHCQTRLHSSQPTYLKTSCYVFRHKGIFSVSTKRFVNIFKRIMIYKIAFSKFLNISA